MLIMKAIQKIASVFLASIFLFSSLGFTINTMVCLKSGKEKVSMAKMEDCCVKKAEPVIVEKDACCEEEALSLPEDVMSFEKGSCCDINSYTFNLTDFQNSQKQSVEQPAIFQSIFYFSELIASTASENKLAFQYSDLPPPLFGRRLLNFISTLTI